MPESESQPVAGWVVRPDVRHERLVWLASEPQLRKINRRWWHFLMALGRTADIDERGLHGSPVDREELDKGLQQSAFVVDGLAARFSPQERETLRLTGRLPDWFWPAYHAQVEAERRR
jgi:hypothetical protein